jgi:predicted nucleic acid-binding protein
MILVDTSVWIDFLKGVNSPERLLLHNLIESGEDISISELILTEILQGIRNDEKFNILLKYFLEFPIFVPGSMNTYLDAAQIYRNCRKKGKTIRTTVDCIIAAICIENDLVLLHKDNDFNIIAQCTGLKILKE